MTTVAILAESGAGNTVYRAIAGMQQSVGSTPGQALDAITPALPESQTGTLVVVQQFRPDVFFNSAQRERLESLMARWRTARNSRATFSEAEQVELEALIDAEIRAAASRAAAMAQEKWE